MQQSIWERYRKNKLALAGLGFIIALTIVAILGYLITPDDSPAANRISLPVSTLPPGSEVLFLKIKKNQDNRPITWFDRLLNGAAEEHEYIPVADYRLTKDFVYIKEFSGDGVVSEEESDYTLADVYYALDKSKPIVRDADTVFFSDLQGRPQRDNVNYLVAHILRENFVKQRFILGTDRYGRDILSRMILGARVSLAVGFLSVLISLVIGVLVGALAGYYRGWTDQALSWLMNVVWVLPTLLLVIAISFALGKGFWQVFVAVGLSMWVDVARLVRGQVLSIREREFVEAARAMGFSNIRILWKHVLPNITGPLLVSASSNFASAILLEAGLSFLGFGAQPPFPTWGSMIKEHYGYIIIDAAYLAFIPGIAIMLLVYAFNLIAIGLRDALDVKSDPSNV